MNVLSKFAHVAMDFNGPPGLTHPLLVENYAWVDDRLRELYNGYALTSSNCDEYEAAGLLKENWAWVDERLTEMCAVSELDLLSYSCPAPLAWANYRSGANLDCIEESNSVGKKRKRSESDVSDYEIEAGRVIKRLRCQSPIPSGKYMDELTGLEFYDYASEVSSIGSEVVHYVTEDEEEYMETEWSDYSDDELAFCDSP
jgi:hypothetical protein